MKKNRSLTRPLSAKDVKFQEFYEAISYEWKERAQRMQLRRWRQLKKEIKGNQFR